MASKSVLIVALLFFVPILCLQVTYADRIVRDAHRIRRDASASASASVPASVVIVALLFCVPILCLQIIDVYRIGRDASASASASASTSASGAIEGGFENGNWDSQGYGDDEERTAAPRKKRFVWTKPQKVKFLQAITQIGLDNAKPKRIHEFMNEPDLTRTNVASHLQKYRKFLVKLKDALAGDEDEHEELGKSSFALGYRELLFNNKRDQQLLNQLQMEIPIGSTFQVQPSAGIGSTLPLTAAASNSSRSIPPLIRSGQSSLLNKNPANFPRQQPTLCNRNGDQLFFQESLPAAFGRQRNNNFENGGNLGLHDLPMMLRTDEQDNYQPPSQQQEGGHDQDQLPYQVEVPDPAANQVPNPSADQVPNPGSYHVEDNHETILEPGMPTVFESDYLNKCLDTCQKIYGTLIHNLN